MSVYVDPIFQWADGFWCHMMADSLDELHTFAHQIGLPDSAFHDAPGHPHYDLRPSKRTKAIQQGAISASRRQMVNLAHGMYRPTSPKGG